MSAVNGAGQGIESSVVYKSGKAVIPQAISIVVGLGKCFALWSHALAVCLCNCLCVVHVHV